ncbi:MAG: C_GCAxxG_C_C family protein [Deltaproteobacteria bacterium]|nr:C_GCAxxG_C_C family protein [Candidatus Tharpella aukensis]
MLSSEMRQEHDENIRTCLLKSRNCAQTSFAVLQEKFDLDGDTVLKALTAFPGIALRCETCGAVTGGLMALGLIFGREELDDEKGFQRAVVIARTFCQRFEKELGSTMCGNIQESKFGRTFDLLDPEHLEAWEAANPIDKCSVVVGIGVRIAAEIIAENQSP